MRSPFVFASVSLPLDRASVGFEPVPVVRGTTTVHAANEKPLFLARSGAWLRNLVID